MRMNLTTYRCISHILFNVTFVLVTNGLQCARTYSSADVVRPMSDMQQSLATFLLNKFACLTSRVAQLMTNRAAKLLD